MRAARLLAVAISLGALSAVAGAQGVDPADAWKPMYSFIGTWKGTRAGADGNAKVTRVYASAATNHHLEITESGGGRSKAAVLGMVSFDAQRQTLVLRQFATDGTAVDLVLDPALSTAGQVVFASGDAEPVRVRITYARAGARTFVERVERSAGSGPFAVVSETHFVRTD
jgi:hypothetical protein